MKIPLGFQSAACAAGIKSSGDLDLTLIRNLGPDFHCASVFTSNQMIAAPVIWSKQVVKGGVIKAVLLNSGGANACTGARGFADTHRCAEYVGELLSISSSEIAICSTGIIGEFLPMEKVLSGVGDLVAKMSVLKLEESARAIMTTDTRPKIASYHIENVTFVGIAKGAGMLAPALATMLSVVMTDAVVEPSELQEVFSRVVERTYNRIDSDGCTSTNDTVLALASGASGKPIKGSELESALTAICSSLASQLISDAEGHTKVVAIQVINANSENDAVAVARACARNNLLKTALFGGDPNWGRILAAVGTADACIDCTNIDVSLNGVMVSRNSAPGDAKELVDLAPTEISIIIDLKVGIAQATIMTNDLSHAYVHENSAYSS